MVLLTDLWKILTSFRNKEYTNFVYWHFLLTDMEHCVLWSTMCLVTMIWIQMDKWLFSKSHHQVGGTLDIHWNLKSQILDKGDPYTACQNRFKQKVGSQAKD